MASSKEYLELVKIHPKSPAAMGFLPASQDYCTVSAINAQSSEQ